MDSHGQKYFLFQLIQGNLFHRLPNEDPYAHLVTYIEICNMVKIIGVPEDAICLNLFSFSVHPLHLYRRCFLFPSHFFSALDETLTRRCPPFFCSNPQEFSPFLLKSAGVLDETPVTIKRSHPLLPSPFFPLKP